MKHRKKNLLRDMAKHLGLKIVFVSYFTNDVHGKLLPREKRILINAHKPRYEHTFTLLHEIAHYLLHFKNFTRKRHARFLDINWKIEWVLNLCRKARKTMHLFLATEDSREWEADLWAFCALFILAKVVECRGEILEFVEHHPEKFWVFMLAGTAVAYSGIKYRITQPFKMLLKPCHAG